MTGGVGREILDELGDPSLVVVRGLVLLLRTLVVDDELEAWHEERGLPGAGLEVGELERRVLGEDLPVRPVADPRAGRAARGLADHAQFALLLERGERRIRALLAVVGEQPGLSAVERHRVHLAAAVDLHVEPLGERVDDRGADAVQTAGAAYEPPPNLPPACSLVKTTSTPVSPVRGSTSTGDAASAVMHLDAAVGVQDDVDLAAVAGHGLVDGVVDDLPQAVHQAWRAVRADVHPGTLADRFEPPRGPGDGGRSTRLSQSPHRIEQTRPGSGDTPGGSRLAARRVRSERNTPPHGHYSQVCVVVLRTPHSGTRITKEASR